MKWVKSLNGVVNLEHVERIYWRHGGRPGHVIVTAETLSGARVTLAERHEQMGAIDEIGQEMIEEVVRTGLNAFETPIPT